MGIINHEGVSGSGSICVGFRHRTFGEEVGAVVKLKPGVTLDDKTLWRHFMTLGYPWDKVPKTIRLSDDVPETPVTLETRQGFVNLFNGLDTTAFPRPDFWKDR